MGRTRRDYEGNAKRTAKHLPYGSKKGDTFPTLINERRYKYEGSAIPVNKKSERQKNRVDLRDIDFDE